MTSARLSDRVRSSENRTITRPVLLIEAISAVKCLTSGMSGSGTGRKIGFGMMANLSLYLLVS